MSRLARSLLVLLVLGCSHTPSEPPPVDPAPATPPPIEVAAPLPAWPTPSLTRVADRSSATDTVTVTLSGASLDGALEARAARGPVAASCEGGVLAEVIRGEDGAQTTHVDPLSSLTICVRDPEGHVRASATTLGHHSLPFAHASRSARGTLLHQAVEPLDDDLTALVYVAMPADTELRSMGCRTQAGAGANDDPPEHCDYDCGGGRVLAEIPRGVIDALVTSPIYRQATSDTELLTPDTLGVQLPIELARDEAMFTCARDREGRLLTPSSGDAYVAPSAWAGCDFDTVSGCIADPGPYAPLRAGDLLLGRTEAGTIVRAPIRRATVRRTGTIFIDLANGEDLSVAADALVLTARGDVRGDELTVDDVLVRTNGRVQIAAVPADARYQEEVTRVDLAGANYVLLNGFAVRDSGGVETESAPVHVEPELRVGAGDGDCSIAVSWRAATTTHDVSLGASLLERRSFAARPADCSAPLVTLDAGALAAVASLGPEAEVVVTLFDTIECSASYAISQCDGARALGEALPVESAAACLPAGTLIDVPAGVIAIEKLERGDVVESFDPRRGLVRAQVLGETVHRDRALLRVVLDDGTTLEATPEHVLMVGQNHAPRTTADLRAGDVLSLRTDGALVERRVLSVAPSRRADVYELRVSAPDTYFANGVLVHNY